MCFYESNETKRKREKALSLSAVIPYHKSFRKTMEAMKALLNNFTWTYQRDELSLLVTTNNNIIIL